MSNHIISYHIISYHIISLHIISLHIISLQNQIIIIYHSSQLCQMPKHIRLNQGTTRRSELHIPAAGLELRLLPLQLCFGWASWLPPDLSPSVLFPSLSAKVIEPPLHWRTGQLASSTNLRSNRCTDICWEKHLHGECEHSKQARGSLEVVPWRLHVEPNDALNCLSMSSHHDSAHPMSHPQWYYNHLAPAAKWRRSNKSRREQQQPPYPSQWQMLRPKWPKPKP